MESKKTMRKIDKIMKEKGWSKKKMGVCANHPECYNHRAEGSKYCDECSIDYINEHKDD